MMLQFLTAINIKCYSLNYRGSNLVRVILPSFQRLECVAIPKFDETLRTVAFSS
jgi:hypothetical protein